MPADTANLSPIGGGSLRIRDGATWTPFGDTTPVVVVEHHMDADVARPVADTVYWIGSVEPTNMTAADTWQDTALRMICTQAAGATFTVSTPAPTWEDTPTTTPRWVFGSEATQDAVQPTAHTWAGAGPREVACLFPRHPREMHGSLVITGQGLTGPIEDMHIPPGLDGSLQLHDNDLSGDLALAPLPQGLTVTLSLRNNTQLTGNLENVRLPQGLTGTLHLHNCNLSGDLTKVRFPQGLTSTFYLSYGDFTGDVAQIDFPQGIQVLAISVCNLSGDLTQAALPPGLTTMNFYSNNITGDLSQLVLPPSINDSIYLQDNNFTGALDISQVPAIGEVNLNANPGITQADVDATIASIYNARHSFTAKAHTLRIEQLPDPSATGLAQIAELVAGDGFPAWTIVH